MPLPAGLPSPKSQLYEVIEPGVTDEELANVVVKLGQAVLAATLTTGNG
jgi:hypothetical protein